MSVPQKILPQRLKELRQALRYSQPQLAELIGSSKQAINNWEHERSMPPLDLACRLADVLNVSLDYLTGRSNNPKIRK